MIEELTGGNMEKSTSGVGMKKGQGAKKCRELEEGETHAVGDRETHRGIEI